MHAYRLIKVGRAGFTRRAVCGMLMIIPTRRSSTWPYQPSSTSLGFSQSRLAWVVNAYADSIRGLLLLAAPPRRPAWPQTHPYFGADRFSPRASALCGVAGQSATFDRRSVVQGVGGAMASALILGLIVAMFPERVSRPAPAIGVFSIRRRAGGSIGLLAGGLLTQAISGTGFSSSTPDWHRRVGYWRIACLSTSPASGSLGRRRAGRRHDRLR